MCHILGDSTQQIFLTNRMQVTFILPLVNLPE